MTWRRLWAQPVAKGCGSEPRTLGSRGHSFGATFSCLLTALQGWDQVVRQAALGPGRQEALTDAEGTPAPPLPDVFMRRSKPCFLPGGELCVTLSEPQGA